MFDWLHQTLPKNTSVSKDVASSKKKKKRKRQSEKEIIYTSMIALTFPRDNVID